MPRGKFGVRRIGGHWYRHHSDHTTKAKAKQVAGKLRGEGYGARVISTSWIRTGAGWAVYVTRTKVRWGKYG